LKTEFVHQNRFEIRQQAIAQLTEYIELWGSPKNRVIQGLIDQPTAICGIQAIT